MQAALGLEPLPGEPVGGQAAGRCMNPAKGRVDRRPDLGPRRIRRKHRPPDVIGADVIHHPALDHAELAVNRKQHIQGWRGRLPPAWREFLAQSPKPNF